MRFTFDPRHNVAYIRFQEKGAQVEAIRISDELVVDIAPDGTIYGIELLNANARVTGLIASLGVSDLFTERTGVLELPADVRAKRVAA